jgi:hypothetical protein
VFTAAPKGRIRYTTYIRAQAGKLYRLGNASLGDKTPSASAALAIIAAAVSWIFRLAFIDSLS